MKPSTWDRVIAAAEGLPDDAYICFAERPSTGAERVLLAGEDDWADGDAVPSPAARELMTACVTKGDLTQIVANAMAQNPSVGPDGLRHAVRHYLEHDAFISFGGEER